MIIKAIDEIKPQHWFLLMYYDYRRSNEHKTSRTQVENTDLSNLSIPLYDFFILSSNDFQWTSNWFKTIL